MLVDDSTKRARFRVLHQTGCFIIPNPWDIGSAKRLERMGFKALASTSSGAARAVGREDGELSRDEVLDHLRQLCAASDLPINADFEAGFADNLNDLKHNVALAVGTGICGLSIEDYKNGRLYDPLEAAERVSAAKDGLTSTGADVLLVARAEGFIKGKPDLDDVIRRLISYSEAGADCLYAPGVKDLHSIRTIVNAVAPKPVNVLLSDNTLRISDLAEIGVRRVSVGGALSVHAWAAFEKAALMLRDQGTLPPLPR